MKQNTIVIACVAMLLTTGIAAAAIANTTPTQGEIPVADGDAPVVIITGGEDIQFDDFGPDQSQTTVNTTGGNISVSGPDSASVTADNIKGEFTNISEIDTASGTVYINPGDKRQIAVAGDTEEVRFRDATLDDGTEDFRYTGGSSGANVTVGGLPAGEFVGAVDADSGDLLDDTEVNQDGTATFGNLPDGQHDILIQEAPDFLVVRNETSPGNKVQPAEVSITFFPQDEDRGQTVTRTTTNGEVQMTDLPTNQSFVVNAETDGYESRQIYVTNLYEQNTVYLYPESQPSVEKVFEYTDYSGNFPQEDTVMIFQRPINDKFTTVSGDVIGATGEQRVTLASNQRHRIVVLNRETGDRQVIGPITPKNTGRQAIEIYSNNEIEISGIGAVTSFAPSTNAVREDVVTFETDIIERDRAIDGATVTVYRKQSGQLTQLSQETTNGAGTVTQEVNLSGYNDSQAVVEAEVNLGDGDTQTVYRNYSINKLYGNTNSLISVMGAFSGALPSGGVDAFETVTALLVSLLLSAAAASRARLTGEGFGVVMVTGMAAFSVIGWLSYGIVFAAGVGMGALVILRRGF